MENKSEFAKVIIDSIMKNRKGAELLCRIVAVSVEASIEAAKVIRDIKKSGNLEKQEKGANDYCTKGDIEAQKIIFKHLKSVFPDLVLKGEEGDHVFEHDEKFIASPNQEVVEITATEVEKLKSLRPDFDKIEEKNLVVWIDPIDGTREYASDDKSEHKKVTTLIGIAYQGIPIAGIITQPFFDHNNTYRTATVWGICGMGVYHDRHNNSDNEIFKFENYSRKDSGLYRIVTSRSRSKKDLIDSLLEIPKTDKKLIKDGGCGYKVLLILDNVADAYIYPAKGTKRWDTCAPEGIIRALGGCCSDVFDNYYDYSASSSTDDNNLGVVVTVNDHKHYIKNMPNLIKEDVWKSQKSE